METTTDSKSCVIPTGTTTFYTMIGTPIIQVKSPLFYNRYFAEHEIDAVMVAMEVPTDQVKDHFNHMRSISNELTSLEGFDLVVNAKPVGMNDDPNVPIWSNSQILQKK